MGCLAPQRRGAAGPFRPGARSWARDRQPPMVSRARYFRRSLGGEPRVLARVCAARSCAGNAGRRRSARRIPQPDDHAAGARGRQRPPHGRHPFGRFAACRSRAADRRVHRHPGTGRQLRSHAAARGHRGGGSRASRKTRRADHAARRDRTGDANRHHARPPRRVRPAPPTRFARIPRALRPCARGRPRRGRAVADAQADPGRRHSAAHPRARRQQPLPLDAGGRRARQRGAAVPERAWQPGRSRGRPASDRHVRHDRIVSSRGDGGAAGRPAALRRHRPRREAAHPADALGEPGPVL
jgi:hypothetical protein